MTSSPEPVFSIWIDADACPGEIREMVLRTAIRRRIPTTFVSNSYLNLIDSEFVSFHLVPPGFDKADDHIAETADTLDLAVTGDIPLAARLIERGIAVLNTRGEEFNASNIGERLAVRNLMENLRNSGTMIGGPREFDRSDQQRFANALDRAITRRLKAKQ